MRATCLVTARFDQEREYLCLIIANECYLTICAEGLCLRLRGYKTRYGAKSNGISSGCGVALEKIRTCARKRRRPNNGKCCGRLIPGHANGIYHRFRATDLAEAINSAFVNDCGGRTPARNVRPESQCDPPRRNRRTKPIG